MLRFFLSLSLLACSAAQASQILTNPGFETGSITPWTNDTRFGVGSVWAITSTNCHTGSFCATSTGNFGLEQMFSPVSVSSITDVSFWGMHPADGATSLLAFDFLYAGGGDDEFTVNTSGTGWNFFDVFSDLRTTGSLVGFEIFGNTGGVTVADDLSITATLTPEPASFGLCFAGLSTFAIAARRLTRKTQ